MSDPKVEERVRELLKPHEFRVGQRRADLGGIRVESSAVDYWGVVHVVVDLLTKLDEAEQKLSSEKATSNRLRLAWREDVGNIQSQRDAAEERERALIAEVREVLGLLSSPGPEATRILSRLLPSTPTEEGKKP